MNNLRAIASISLGQHPSHALDAKIIAAAKHNFNGIEIVYSDLEAYSTSKSLSLIAGAKAIKALCIKHNLTILALAPFKNFEGHHSPLETRLQTVREWLSIAEELGALHFQVPSQFDPSSTGENDVIIEELRQLADLAANCQPPIKVAYETVAWGLHNATWQDSLRVVEEVNRSNFGLCIDAFHIIARIWGDNRISNGVLPDGEKALKESLRAFTEECPVERIFYVQLSDGEKFDPPLGPGHQFYDEKSDHRLTWSRNGRPFPLEKDLGAYFPIVEFTRASVVDNGFSGWVSFEIFDRTMRKEENGPELAAARAEKSWQNVENALGS